MGPIKDISGLSQNLKKLDKQNESRKVDSKKEAGKVDKNNQVSSEQDKAEISDAGRTLLNAKTESINYVKDVENSRLISESELSEIREKVNTGYYFDQKVVDKIAEKLLELPNYLKKAENNNPDSNNKDDQEQLNA